MTRATGNGSGTAEAWTRRHRGRVRAALAALLALTLAGASVAAAGPAYAVGGHVVRGTVPNVDGTDGGGAVITVRCFGNTFETRSAPAQADGTWQVEMLSPVGTFCDLVVDANPFGGTYRFQSYFELTDADKVVAVDYPEVIALDVVTPPGAAGPTGTAYTSSEGEFTFADGTTGYLQTWLSWDPTQGPVSYARGIVNDFSYEVDLTNGYRLTDTRYLSSAPGSLTVNVPRTRVLTASGDVVNATATTEGQVTLRCGQDEEQGNLGLSYSISLLTVEAAPCTLGVTSTDGDAAGETTGERPVAFTDGTADADVAVPPLRTVTVVEDTGQPVTDAMLAWQAGASFTLSDGAVQNSYTDGRAVLTGSPVTVPVPAQDGGVGFTVTFDAGGQYSSDAIEVDGLSEITITLPPRLTYQVSGTIRDGAGGTGSASLGCGATSGYAAVQPDGSFAITAEGFAAPTCSVSVYLQVGTSSYSSYSITRPVNLGPPSGGIMTGNVELALPEPIDLHAVTPGGAPTNLTGNISSSDPAALMPDGAVASVSAYHQGFQFTDGLVSLRLPRSDTAYHYLTDNAAYSSYGSFSLLGASEATFVASGPPGRWYPVGPTTSTDADGVPDVVENGVPGGDGNGDGQPDSEQPDVTSLPGADGSYVTLQSETGTTFGPVSTQDGSALPPPPAGVTLPAGLVSFRVDGVTPGGTTTVRIYSGSLDGVTGWAKYHDGSWVTLPAGDVSIHPAYVEISLTDGGPFDDDGVANGSILDPGGPAVVTDAAPPTVSCDAAPTSWSATNVSIACTASDEGSGLADPADAAFTLSTSVAAGTETSTAQTSSREVCDAAGNCATAGPIAGIKVDRLGPAITITSPADGAEITQGAAPAAAYTCSDAGSGQGSCSGTVAVGQPVPTAAPGTATFLVTATDAVGNVSTRSVTYQVRLANTAPVVSADMGVTGLEEIGTQSGALQLTARFTDVEGNGPFTASVQWAPGTTFRAATVTGTSVTATAAYTSSGTRTVVVKVCDAQGACGTDAISVRTFVRDRVAPVAECVVDRGSAVAPRYVARFGYSSRATVPLWIPVLPGIENTFLRDPARRGQPTVFLPGVRRSVLEVAFAQGDVGWRINGTTATASSKTRRC